MSISVGASPDVLSQLQSLLQQGTAGASDAASPGNPLAGLFQSNSGIGAMVDPSTFATAVVDTKSVSGGSPLGADTIGALFTLQAKSDSGANVQPTIFGTQNGKNGDSPVDQTDPRHLPAANPTHAHRHRHTPASDGVSQDSSSFAQNAVAPQVSTAADSVDAAGSAPTNVASGQNILLDQLMQLQKQLVTVASPILSTII